MPRSPSRDLVDRFTGHRGYFHEPDGVRRWKNGAAVLAMGLVLGWFVIESAWSGRVVSAHTHGELASPHAAFNANCEACHKPHSPGDFISHPTSLVTTHSRWHDLNCSTCHPKSPHHAADKNATFHEQCSQCHHDHQGRDNSLVKMSDRHCTQCHADLPAAHVSGKSTFAEKVTGFAKDHPEFRPLASGKVESERRLKFSHALHMSPGLVYDANDQHKWTPESLGKRFGADARDRFVSPGASTTEAVQLVCSSCHQLDAGLVPPDDPDRRSLDLVLKSINGAARKSLLPARSEGAYYLPINFDLHCKVCHPLRTPSSASGKMVIKELFVPHRFQPGAMRQRLRGEIAVELALGKHAAMAEPIGPGGRLDPPKSPPIATFGGEIDRLTDAAMKSLLADLAPAGEQPPALAAGCAKCHYAAGPNTKDIAPLPNKTVWFEHAKFNHGSHRGLTCASCHPGTTAGPISEREPALIVGIKTCQVCHADSGQSIELPGGPTAIAAGIRHSCVDCHRYHNGDRPMQGLGSRKRDPAEPLDLGQWLNGKK